MTKNNILLMEKALILSVFITIMYFVLKLVDMKYISKEWKPMKTVIRDSLLILVSSTITVLIYFLTNGRMNDFFNILTDNKTLKPSATEIFTGEPGF